MLNHRAGRHCQRPRRFVPARRGPVKARRGSGRWRGAHTRCSPNQGVHPSGHPTRGSRQRVARHPLKPPSGPWSATHPSRSPRRPPPPPAPGSGLGPAPPARPWRQARPRSGPRPQGTSRRHAPPARERRAGSPPPAPSRGRGRRPPNHRSQPRSTGRSRPLADSSSRLSWNTPSRQHSQRRKSDGSRTQSVTRAPISVRPDRSCRCVLRAVYSKAPRARSVSAGRAATARDIRLRRIIRGPPPNLR